MKAFMVLLLIGLTSAAYPKNFESRRTEPLKRGPLLRSFDGFKYDVVRGRDGVYRFEFHTGDYSRTEKRDEDGFVQGEYAFVAPEGNEYEFKYEADKDGFRVESDALPEHPEDTDAVKQAREEFLSEYEKALERAKEAEDDDDDEDDDDSDDDDDDESSEEDDDESSEESSEEDDDDDETRLALYAYGFGNAIESDESSEESSEESDESDEDDDDDEDEEDDEEEENEGRSNVPRQNLRTVAQRVEPSALNSAAFSHFGIRTAPYPIRRRNQNRF